MSDKPKTMSWWSHDEGWTLAPAPKAYLAMDHNHKGDWSELRQSVGYDHATKIGNTYDGSSALDICIYRHLKEHHSLIEIDDLSGIVIGFFVAEKDMAAFVMDKLPALMSAITQDAIAKVHERSESR